MAAQQIGFNTGREYIRGYKQDSKLPSNPKKIYSDDWEGWYVFLGNVPPQSKYQTYEEAKKAARRFAFSSSYQYEKGYKKDPRLPSQPLQVYKEDWVDWYEFLGCEPPEDKYQTYPEAAKAAKKIGFKGLTEYGEGYHQDSKLPARPDNFYNDDWVDWYDYLGNERPSDKYLTYQEARKAAQSYGFKGLEDYKHKYECDLKLPANPNQYYPEDWVDWFDYLGNERPKDSKYRTYKEARKVARAFGFSGLIEYGNNYHQDSKLPARPDNFYKDDWVDWYDYLGNTKPVEKYKTYKEAQKAAHSLGFLSSNDYCVGFQQDPRLPAKPFVTYIQDWVNWFEFLGTECPEEKYQTYEDARRAAKSLGFSGAKEYGEGYRLDEKLPAHPHVKYADSWIDWYDFLGNERPEDKYQTYQEAKYAAQVFRFSNSRDYRAGYQQDPKLPSLPGEFYPDDWTGWYDFLDTESPIEKYQTYEEAKTAAQALGFSSSPEYFSGYKKDPKLTASPNIVYADSWIDWYEFLGTERAYNPDLEKRYSKLFRSVNRYVEEGVNQTSKLSNLKSFIRDVVAQVGLIDDPGSLLSNDIAFPNNEYIEFVNSTGDTQKRGRHNICVSFFDWVMDEYCSDEDDEGVLTPLPGYRNPLKTILKGLLDQLPTARPSESVKPALPISVILRGRSHLIPSEAKTFKDLYQLHPFYDDCWVQIDPSLIDASDPNCIYREVEIQRKGKVTQIWSPVKLIALYTLLNMPLRGQQILWLDSGEGDEYIPIWQNNTVQWIKNTNKLATNKRQQGFIKKGNDDSWGSYITTNKTGRKVGGYSVPWMPESVAYWIIQLRDWQSKYNPLHELTPWARIKLRQKTNEKILKARGKQAFLFRDPASMACKDKVSPMFTTTAFTRSLPALLFNIQQPGEDLAQPVAGSTTQYKSQFTPHCLRVSLITAYIVDGGAPIHVISKLVGHASLVMTIYYTKVGHSRIKQALGDAEKKAAEQNVDRIQDLILQKRLDEAKPELITTDRGLFDSLGADWPAAAYQVTSLGICPMGGAGCNEGGELLVDRTTEMTYAPVAAGYLGTRNCPRCRFFITGPAFLGGLQAIANEVMLEINVLRGEYHELELEMQALEDERYDVESSGHPFKNRNKLKKVTASYEEKAKKLDVLLCDFQNLYRLISQSIELLNKEDSGKNQLIVSDQYVEIGMQLSEQQSDFRLLAEVCSNSEIYTSSSASRALPLLSQMLDKLADINGIAPSMFRLTEKQQLKAANQIVSLIMQRADHDWNVADRLINGSIMLEDLEQNSQFSQLHKEIESIMHGALKLPITPEGICDV